MLTPDRPIRFGRESVPASKLSKPGFEDGLKVAFLVDEGAVEIHDPRLFRAGQEPFCRALAGEAVGPGGARRVEVRLASAFCRIEYEPGGFDRDAMATRVADTLRSASSRSLGRISELDLAGTTWTTLSAVASGEGPLIWETPDPGPERQTHKPRKARRSLAQFEFGSSRVVNLALAGGSFAMAVAGVILPGIPSLPLLILTGHYLLRSSPELCRRLELLPGVGALLRQAEEMGDAVLDRKSLVELLVVSVLTASAFLILHPPLPLVMLLEAGIFAFVGLRQIGNPTKALTLAGTNRLSLA